MARFDVGFGFPLPGQRAKIRFHATEQPVEIHGGDPSNSAGAKPSQGRALRRIRLVTLAGRVENLLARS